MNLTHHILLVTGIAQTDSLVQYLKEKSTVSHLRFGDHHTFSEKDIRKIEGLFNSFAKDDKIILTTEKDAKRFQSLEEGLKNMLIKLPLYFIEMEMEFINEENNENIEQKILSHVRNFE